MTKAATKSADAADTKVLIVLGYDEDQKPRGARFPATDAPSSWTSRSTKRPQKNWLPLPRNSAAWSALLERQGLCAKRQAKSVQPDHRGTRAPASGRHRQRQRRPAGSGWPAPVLGRDRAWPPRHRPGSFGIRLVGSHRYRAQRRHAHATVPGLPKAAQVLTPSGGSRFDQRGGAVRLTGLCR